MPHSAPPRSHGCAPRRHPSTPIRVVSRVRSSVLLLLLFAITTAATTASAENGRAPGEGSPALALEALEDRGWRQKGLAYIDLPLGIRARVEARYTRHLYSSDILSQRHLADAGPEILGDRTLESRIALTRAIGDGVELEIAWESRNNLEVNDPMAFGRQTIGARIRITP